MNKWYTPTKYDALQGLVIDESTGANIAVTYDPKDAQKIAALPELVEALRNLLDDVEYARQYIEPGLIGARQVRAARAALALLEGDNSNPRSQS